MNYKIHIFNKNNLMVFITGEDKELNLLKENMNKVIDVLSAEASNNNDYTFMKNKRMKD